MAARIKTFLLAALLAICAALPSAPAPARASGVTNVPSDEVVIALNGTPSNVTSAPLAMTPAFDPNTQDYVMHCSSGVNNLTFSVTTASGVSNQAVSLGEDQAVILAPPAGQPYWVRCLPHDFPVMAVSGSSSTFPAGWYLTGTLTTSQNSGQYAMILDRNGTPVWYQREANAVIDMEMVNSDPEQPVLAWAPNLGPGVGANPQGAWALANLANQSRSLVPAGYPGAVEPIDPHELLPEPGSNWMGITTQLIPPPAPLPGALSTDTQVVDCLVQEFNSSGQVLWSWRASQHVAMGEMDTKLAATANYNGVQAADVFHCNSIDGNPATGDVLVSMRNTDSVYDINSATRTVRWKLGGNPATSSVVGPDNEQVLVSNDPLGFFGQHDARYEPNGDISIYDDNTGGQGPARGVEYTIAPPAATLVKSWPSPDGQSSGATGSFRRYAGGSDNVVGWGFKTTSGFTEFDNSPVPAPLFSVTFPTLVFEYRVVKVPLSALDPNVLRLSAGLPRALRPIVGWSGLGGIGTSKPAVASWAPGREDLFVRGSDNQLWHKWYSGGGWSGWEPLGGALTNGPAVAAWGPNRLDVFVRGTDDQLWHKWWDGTRWNGWECLGGILAADPGVAAWGSNRLDVFVRGNDNQMWHKWWDGRGWSGWEGLGGTLASDPSVSSWATNRLDVFVEGNDNQVWHKWWDGVRWNQWEARGGNLTAGTAASSPAVNQVAVTAIGSGSVPEVLLYNNGWYSWEPLGGLSNYSPAMLKLGPSDQDVFVTGTDGQIYHGDLSIAASPYGLIPVSPVVP